MRRVEFLDKPDTEQRRHWMAVLARGSSEELRAAWNGLIETAEARTLKPAETGLVMVRGRAGGNGKRFNLGEMTVTRCAVEIGGHIGHGYVKGRDRVLAEYAARFDALLQDDAHRAEIMRSVIEPLAEKQQAVRDRTRRKAAATKVEFFTMVRGDG